MKLGDNWFLDEQVKRDKDNPQQGYVRAFPESVVWEETRGEDSIWTWESNKNMDHHEWHVELLKESQPPTSRHNGAYSRRGK